jgi:hypothetical protein
LLSDNAPAFKQRGERFKKDHTMNTDILERVPAGVKKALAAEEKQSSKLARKLAPEIKANHFHRWTAYEGSAEALIAAGLVTAKQLPREKGDRSNTQFRLGGSAATCAAHGTQADDTIIDSFSVYVEGPQPPVCQRILKAIGDGPELQKIVEIEMMGPFNAVHALSDHFPEMPFDGATFAAIIDPAIAILKQGTERARAIFTGKAVYQKHWKQAAGILDDFQEFCDQSWDSGLSEKVMRSCLLRFAFDFAAAANKAASDVKSPGVLSFEIEGPY